MEMVAVFLATLFQYYPLLPIGGVFLCFLVTAALLLGWFGFDVPVILRTSDEEESSIPTPEKRMVQVTNPFALEICSGPASVSDGVSVKACCLEPCVLTCFWGCDVLALQQALQAHQRWSRLCTPEHFQEALQHLYNHCQRFYVAGGDGEDNHTQIPADLGVTDFGTLPRDRYPLVAVLTLSEAEAREAYNIVASVTVIHVPDEMYKLSARILFQYLLTAEGNMYDLKPLFMSASSAEDLGRSNSDQTSHQSEQDSSTDQSPLPEATEVEEERDWSEASGKDCVVCQNAAVNRVLLPCRHACVCNSCVSHFDRCPICRSVVLESFCLSVGHSTQEL
ncbi:cell growth regulator with RING finger domain protein 1 [Synchiropus picturatus]